jgi:N-acetylneuraminate epimerase
MSVTKTIAQSMAGVNYNFTWGQLAPIPDNFGFAGSFSGTSHGALIVAGGANFPDGGAPWTGSKKAWSDKIFVLEEPGGQWKLAGHLPQAMGYGVSLEYDNKLICAGGSNEAGHTASVIAISYVKGQLVIERCADLPQPLANACGMRVNMYTAYIAGGLLTPDAKTTANVFWTINLRDYKTATWQQLETWPGPPRMLSVAGTAVGGVFYLFSGTTLEDKNGATHRQYLKDAYKYTPGKGWQKLHDMPAPVVAAAGPAFGMGKNELLIFGGDDGKLADDAANLKEKHPGFSDKVLIYNKKDDAWTGSLTIPTDKKADVATNPNGSVWAPVTTNAVYWNHMLVFPGGEVRPAIRTPRVLTARYTRINN